MDDSNVDSPSVSVSPQDEVMTPPENNSNGSNNTVEPDGQSQPLPPSKDAATQLQTLTHHILEFLSNASNETLAAVFVGLLAATYVILGRLGLLLIGAVGGVILHATWEGFEKGAGDGEAKVKEARKKRELSAEVAKRVLEWREDKVKRNVSDSDEESTDVTAAAAASDDETEYAGFRPATGAALTTLTDAIIRDYVRYARLHSSSHH